jgi:hypothetical protein
MFDLGLLGPDTLAAASVFAVGRQSGRRIDRAELGERALGSREMRLEWMGL